MLFVCVRNSGKSQIAAALAEQWLRAAQLAGDYRAASVRVLSAGTQVGERLNPQAAAAVAEVGASFAGYYPKQVTSQLLGVATDVVLVGEKVRLELPLAQGVRLTHWHITEPAAQQISGMRRMRLIRDDINVRVAALLEQLCADAADTADTADTVVAPQLRGVARAAAVVQALLDVDGCQWHQQQTHKSLTRYLIEETYEVLDAIDRELPMSLVAEELGDVLYQVLFHAELAARAGSEFNLQRIGDDLADKLIARHPHVFADLGQKTAAELEQMWEQLKAAQRARKAAQTLAAADGGALESVQSHSRTGERRVVDGTAAKPAAAVQAVPDSIFAGIAQDLPTLAKAQKIAERLRSAGRNPHVLLADFTVQDAPSAYAAELYELVARAVSEGVDVDMALRVLLAQRRPHV